MIVEIQYKSTIIRITIENELSVKVENLKSSLKASLQKELENFDKSVNINYEKTINKNTSIQNKNVSINSTIKPTAHNHKYQIKTAYKEEIRELLLNADRFSWRLFEINRKTQVPLEKKDEDYIKVSDSCKQGKEEIKLYLSRSFKGQQSYKTNLQSKLNNTSLVNQDTSEMIRIMTGGKEKLKVQEKDKKNKLNDLLQDDPDLILQTLMGMNSNSEDTRVAFIQDLLGVRVGQSQNSSSSNSNNNNSISVENNPRSNFQNRVFQSILNIGGNRPIIPRPAPTIIPNPVKLQQLLEMGFDEDRAKRALIMTRNNLEAAVEVIANDQDLSFQVPNESLSSVNQHSEILNNHEDDDELHIDELSDEDI